MTPSRSASALLPLATALAWGFAAAAQGVATPVDDEPRVYDGPLAVAGYAGQARYQYRLGDDGDTVRAGGFLVEGYDLESLLGGGDNSFRFRGSFRDDVPSDRWRLEFGQYTASPTADVEGLEYRVKVDGRHRQLQGGLRRGRLDSKWTASVRRVERSRLGEELFRGEVTFSAGVPQQAFRLEGGGATLLGRFKRDGLAHDTWTLYTETDAQAEWSFRDGWLREIRRGGAPAVPVFGAGLGEGRLVNLDERYLRALALWLEVAGRDVALAGDLAVELIATNAALYRKAAAVVNDLGAIQQAPLFPVRLPYAAPAERDIARLDSVGRRLARYDAIAAALDATTSLRIAESTDGEVAFLRAALRAVDAELLAPVRELDSTYRAGLLAYLPRDRYLARLWPGGEAPAAVNVRYEAPGGARERAFALDDGPFDVAGAGLAAVSALASRALQAADSVRHALGVKLETEERQRVANALDAQLMADFTRLDSLVRAAEGRLPAEYGLAEVRALAREELRAYGALDDPLAEREAAGALIACVEDLNALALALIDLPARAAEVEALYTDEVWNNITATVMEETVKRRLYEAYADDLLPYFRAEVSGGELDCGRAGVLGAQLRSLDRRMRALREVDTERLEKKLKRVDNPRRLLALLEVVPQS